MDSRRADIPSLPEDTLRAMVLAAIAERDAAVSERVILLVQNERLRHLLLKQMQLGPEAPEQAIAKGEAEAEKRDPAIAQGQRGQTTGKPRCATGTLPRIEVTLGPDDIACPCCQTPMTMIGEDSSKRLDVIQAQYRVIVTKRPKFTCRTCTGTVVQAPALARLDRRWHSDVVLDRLCSG